MLNITIDDTVTYQTVEGFGAFGGKVEMWEHEKPYYTDGFLYRILNDLGITVARNEIYPPALGELQDSSWDRQKDFLKAYQEAAIRYNTPLKFIASVWSPPANMKENNSAKYGGALKPDKYEEFGYYLLDAVDKYHEISVPLYALSIQNEPEFAHKFNSCIYSAEAYRDALNVIGPILKAKYPDLLLFGHEHMIECVYSYNDVAFEDEKASKYLDRFAVHGYSDGENPILPEKAKFYWKRVLEYTKKWGGVPTWMTETSNLGPGYTGAFYAALSMITALKYGQMSSWVWWMLSESVETPFSLMTNGQPKHLYYASKNFYRFIRPGAKMIGCTYEEDRSLIACAFKHEEEGTLTVVVVNDSEEREICLNLKKDIYLDWYFTTGGNNCEFLSKKKSTESFKISPRSIHTFYSKDY